MKSKIWLITNKDYLFKVILFTVAVLLFEACTVLEENNLVEKNTLTITANPNPLIQNSSGEIIFTFNQDVSEFTTSDIDFSGFNVDQGEFITNSKKKYTWKITPRESGDLNISIPVNSFEDLAGNLNTKTFSTNFSVKDTDPPLLTNVSIISSTSLEKDTPGEIVFYFNEAVSEFTTSDINLSGVRVDKKELTVLTANSDLKKYTWQITPKAVGKLSMSINADSIQDLAGNSLSENFTTNFSIGLPLGGKYSLEDVVNLGEIPSDRSKFHELAKDVLSYYTNVVSPEVVAKYVKTNGSGDGSSWAKATNDVKAINGISDASDSKIYLVLVASGEYSSDKIAMKNHVAIIGGWSLNAEWERAGITRFDGQDENRVFYNDNNNLNHTALLYSATITNGKATGKGTGMYNVNSSPTLVNVNFSKNEATTFGGGMYNKNSSPKLVNVNFTGNEVIDSSFGYGGGMFNDASSSPTLVKVNFTRNKAQVNGGGMYNSSSSPKLVGVNFTGNEASSGSGGGMVNYNNSSPSLTNVTFSGNTADRNGGGMYNNNSSPKLVRINFIGNKASSGSGGGMYNTGESSPTLKNVTFSGNTATTSGGGMYNNKSSPTLVNATFSENTATTSGGGMYNNKSSPTLVNATFSKNTATTSGGGIFVSDDSGNGGSDISVNNKPLLVNTIFWRNLTNGSPNQVSFENATDKLSLHYSIIQDGTNDLGGVLTSSHTTEGDPLLSPLADNGGFIKTHVLEGGSPAIDAGVYVKRKGTTFYFSQDNTDWYTGFDNNGLKTTATPPSDAEDLTATDARGYNRVDRPDIGAYENGGTAPSAN